MAGANSIKVNHFRGIDVSVPEDQVELYRATDAINMIPDAVGQIRKRPGVQLLEKGDRTILYEIEGRCRIYGRNIYDSSGNISFAFLKDGEFTELFTCAGVPLIARWVDRMIAFAWQRDFASDMPIGNPGTVQGESYGALVAVLEGEAAYIYTDNGNKYTYTGTWLKETIPADDPLLKTPLNQIGSDPQGGGTPLEVINLLNPWATEQFCTGESGASIFKLNNQGAESDEEVIRGATMETLFRVEVLTEVEQTEGTTTEKMLVWKPWEWSDSDGYRPEKNWIYLAAGVGATPKDGEDNLRITYRRAGFGAAFNALCKAQCATTYGVGGFKDRLFLGGGSLKNRIYYSEMEDPLYIGDLNFIELEQGAEVMELSGIGSNLAAITKNGVYFAAAQVSGGEEGLYATDALFTVSTGFPAPEPIEGGGVAILGGEIVYLSKEGVVAVTSKDQYSERYAEHRSATVDRKMLADGPRFLCSFGRYLLIFCENGICWLLDENQPNTEGNKPYAAHQYEGYRMDGFAADFAYQDSLGRLILSWDGCLYQWMSGNTADHFEDRIMEGVLPDRGLAVKAIEAFWETPWISGTKFYLRKNFRRLGVLLDLLKGVNTAILVEGKKNAEDWKILLDYDGKLCTFDFGNIDFRYFTFASEPGCPDIKKKIRIKKATRFKLRFSNNIIGQTLILNQWGLDYVQED